MKESYFHEDEPFLRSDASETDSDAGLVLPGSRKPRRRLIERTKLLYAMHMSLMALYTVGFVASIYALNAKYQHGPDVLSNQLGREALEYEPVVYKSDYHKMNEYFGDPSAAKEHAWNQLLEPSTVRIPPSFMEGEARPDGIQIPGGDFIGTMTVHHDLHCLKRIWRLIYPEYFYPNASQRTMDMSRGHAHHCMSKLRQSIMCHGDTTPITYQFGPKQAIPLGNSSSPHLCVNWNKLDTWARDNMVDPFKPGLVVHPKYGPAYADMSDVQNTGVLDDEQDEHE